MPQGVPAGGRKPTKSDPPPPPTKEENLLRLHDVDSPFRYAPNQTGRKIAFRWLSLSLSEQVYMRNNGSELQDNARRKKL